MPTFSAILLTAAPLGQASEAGGAFVKVDGRECLLRSIELFLNRDPVKQIMVVFSSESAEDMKRRHGPHFSFSGVKVVTGGPEWLDQLTAAAQALSTETTHVIVHDAARPAVPYTDIEAIFEAAETTDAAMMVTPVRNALLELDDNNNAAALHPADHFMQMLTPQLYSKPFFQQFTAARQPPDVRKMKLIKGSPLNVRVSGSGDATLVKAMLNMLPKPRKGAMGAFEEAQW